MTLPLPSIRPTRNFSSKSLSVSQIKVRASTKSLQVISQPAPPVIHSSVTLQYACFCISEPGPVRYGSTVSATVPFLLQLQFSYSDRSDSLNILLSVLAPLKPTVRFVDDVSLAQVCVRLGLIWVVRKNFPPNETYNVALQFVQGIEVGFALNSS